MPKLSAKQKKFCKEYLIDLNATQAAIRAGYSKKTAFTIGSENLRKPYISLHISQLQKDLQDKTGISAESVIAELAKIGFSNVKNFVNGGNQILEIKHLEDRVTAALSSIKTTVKADGDVVTEVKLHDKVTALNSLGKHLGIFEKDNEQAKSNTVIIVE